MVLFIQNIQNKYGFYCFGSFLNKLHALFIELQLHLLALGIFFTYFLSQYPIKKAPVSLLDLDSFIFFWYLSFWSFRVFSYRSDHESSFFCSSLKWPALSLSFLRRSTVNTELLWARLADVSICGEGFSMLISQRINNTYVYQVWF